MFAEEFNQIIEFDPYTIKANITPVEVEFATIR